MDPLDIIARLDGDNPPNDSELAQAAEQTRAALDAATSADRPNLEVARDLREALDRVTAEQTARAERAEAERAEAAKLRAGIFDQAEAESDDNEDEADQAEAKAKEEKVPVAASATSRVSVIERLRQHAAKVAPAEPEAPSTPQAEVRAIGPAAGFQLDPGANLADLGQLFATHAKSVTSGSTPLVRLTKHFSEDRTLGNNVELNNARLAKVFGPAAPRVAAGGLCGPGDVDFTHPICSDTGRPVRDGLVQYNASRGRVTFAPSMSLADLAPNISVWTSTTDANPGAATKPCPPLVCPEELSCSVDAIVKCITVGNFQAKFSPEWWAASLQVALAAFDREAEQKAIAEIHAASQLLTAVDEGSTLAAFLTAINRVISTDRSINRNINGGYTVIADAWIRDAIRNQVIINLGVANNVDAIQVADAQIAGWLTSLGVSVIWTWDGTLNAAGTTHNVLTDPNVFPTASTVYVFPADAFLFLDGGTLDLGTSITDSSLNATNDRQAFAESFEKVCFRGCSAYAVPINVEELCGCPVTAP